METKRVPPAEVITFLTTFRGIKESRATDVMQKGKCMIWKCSAVCHQVDVYIQPEDAVWHLSTVLNKFAAAFSFSSLIGNVPVALKSL